MELQNSKLFSRVLVFQACIPINKIKKEINIPILTNYDNNYLSKDLMINKILSLNSKIKNKKEFIEKEFKQKPIIK